MATNSIWIRLQFEGFHRWDSAPDEVAFLRHRHRHLFHVCIEWDVAHADRHREFIIERRKALAVLEELKQHPDVETWSCETWANAILAATGATRVEVSEDGENGAKAWVQ